MGFKEDIRSDVTDTFLGMDEFADMHRINGTEVPAVVDKLVLSPRGKRLRDSHEDGYYRKGVQLCVEAGSIGSLPAVGGLLLLDGRKYMVKEAADEDGLYRIVLEVMRQ